MLAIYLLRNVNKIDAAVKMGTSYLFINIDFNNSAFKKNFVSNEKYLKRFKFLYWNDTVFQICPNKHEYILGTIRIYYVV